MRYIVPVLLLLALPAQGAQATQKDLQKPTLKLEPGACDFLVKHTPSPDIAYQGGLDAYGRAVAPADLSAPAVPIGGTASPIEIPLSVDLANRLNLPEQADGGIGPGGALGRYGNQAYIGTVAVLGDTVLLNGEPITDEAEANLAVLCMQANK